MNRQRSEITSARPDCKQAEFLADVRTGLQRRERWLPCKYFYDEIGSQLFDEICELDEYYLTRTELGIMQTHVAEISQLLGPRVLLAEPGSGSSLKTRLLLSHLDNPVAYVPIDISRAHLMNAAAVLADDFPEIPVAPVCADFTCDFTLPATAKKPNHRAIYFPGSTIGNFEQKRSLPLLKRIAALCEPGGSLLIGVDLKKDVSILEAAYNDRRGLTAAFNLNLLHRINRELDADFDVDQFEHRALWNARDERIELFLVSCVDQTVTIADDEFTFDEGEMICTEYSHKYTIDGISQLAAAAGFAVQQTWTDDNDWFAVMLLTAR